MEGIRSELGRKFVRELDGIAVPRWYENLTGKCGLADNTAVRHFNVMHHSMKKASTLWSKETGIDRNPAETGAEEGEQQGIALAMFGYCSAD